MKKLAVTGSLAAGKSTLYRWFESRGALYVSADTIAAELLDLHSPFAEGLIEWVGARSVAANQLELNRKVIADRLFSDAELLDRVEQWVHPYVRERILQTLDQKDAVLGVAEIPLLYEVGWQSLFDKVLVVVAQEPIRLQRYLSRPQASEADFKARQRRFLDDRIKRNIADYVVDTEQDPVEVSSQLESIWQQLQ